MTGGGGLGRTAPWLAAFTAEGRGLQSLTVGALFTGVPTGLFGLGVLLAWQLRVGPGLRRQVAPVALAATVLIAVAAPFVWRVPDDARGPMPPLYSGDLGAGPGVCRSASSCRHTAGVRSGRGGVRSGTGRRCASLPAPPARV
ncbi:hypothetical protein V1J52_03120 [Streptomyces sp. TRM 70351]|uniref:hypothetical protein n=1 Tax=Streptomyces sp. TRM 70351 TaxID=3116552 RepID=UPI002E7BE08C|nr:hypothetical protein [Streptomyces sp. TRM 70351]MEE1927179.1 hypothetical protein [Streptomyces sp. TRM 70351]